MTRNVSALTQRELQATFFSPIAYVVAAVFLVATGYIFMENTLKPGEEASIRPLLQGMAWMLVFTVPLLTMRSIADEYASGTIEALMTAPVTDVEVVLGKFFGVWMFFVALVATTLVHTFLLFRFASGDFSVVMFGYFGILLLGAFYCAVGLFASALSRHQLVAALIGVGILSLFTLVVDSLAAYRTGAWRVVLGYVNILYQFEDFAKGIFDSKSVIFFLSGTVFFLFLTVKVLESRRWR